jgi:NAD(P)-dependent dehydrogenase (short-subunit alcohol dehydrogenase family)
VKGAPHQDLPVVLLTGVNGGLGEALARALMDQPYRLALTGRAHDMDAIRNRIPPSERMRILELDVTCPEQCAAVVADVQAAWSGVDILINNAGISCRSVIEHLSDQDLRHQMAVNFEGPMRLSRLVMERMRRRRWGHIINISSVGGMMAMPTMGAYSASKFALEGATEALWYELRPWNVRVSIGQIGFVRSPSYRKVVWSEKARTCLQGNSDYAPYYQRMGDFIGRLMDTAPSDPERIARRIVRLMRSDHPPLRFSLTIDAHGFALMRRLLPRSWYHRLLYANLPGVRYWVASP